MAQAPADKAFIKADAHSKRVRHLRWLLPLAGAIIAVLFIGVSYVRSLFSQIEIGPLQLEGNALVLQAPKIAGVDKHGRAYDVIAKTARQSIAAPKKVELSEIEAKMQLVADGWARVSSDSGVFDGETERVTLSGNIHVTSSQGYDMRLDSLDIDTKAGAMISEQPVTAAQGDNKISADRMKVIDSGEVIRFEGNVRAEFKADSIKRTP
jgi:lipopolysaccharide export system protein LptC